MKAIYFEEPADQFSCVERAWRDRLDDVGGQAIFLRSRRGRWSGKPGSWSIKYLISGRAAFCLEGQWCDIFEGFCFVVPEQVAYRSVLHSGRAVSIFGRPLAKAETEPELSVWGVFELTGKERKAVSGSLAALEERSSQGLSTDPDQGSQIQVDRPFPAPQSWRKTRLAVRRWLRQGPARVRSAQRLLNARHFLTARFREHDVCTKAANQANMTRSHFSREFSKLFGKSPRQHLIDYRTNVACQLLASGRLKVEQVAAQLGYNHASSLNHLFQRKEMTSPGNHRFNLRPDDSR
ncbi:MAG TPA: AraC family transcriptional regulator [Xanthomonadales bacterium]|nr:AraC family transcriptional regulator [Xanthomonadales bacterium]